MPSTETRKGFFKKITIIIIFSTTQASCQIMAFNLSAQLLLKSDSQVFKEPLSFGSQFRMQRV